MSFYKDLSEFDLFFFVDQSSQKDLELTFKYPKNICVNNDVITFDVFTQPGIVKMPIEFIFQAFADSQISIKNCDNTEYKENISSCLFVAPNTPKNITITKNILPTPVDTIEYGKQVLNKNKKDLVNFKLENQEEIKK